MQRLKPFAESMRSEHRQLLDELIDDLEQEYALDNYCVHDFNSWLHELWNFFDHARVWVEL